MRQKKLSLNFQKTKCMLITKRKKEMNFENSNVISRKKYINHLWVIIDEKLTRKEHINKTRKNLVKGVLANAKLKSLVNIKTLIAVY